jgi:hypothetical protein
MAWMGTTLTLPCLEPERRSCLSLKQDFDILKERAAVSYLHLNIKFLKNISSRSILRHRFSGLLNPLSGAGTSATFGLHARNMKFNTQTK